jgi:hypothetical protein
MRRPKKPESGVMPVSDRTRGSGGEISRACHEIIDAAAAAMVNVDFITEGSYGEKRAASDDLKHSVTRIADLANEIRRIARASSESVLPQKTRERTRG